MGAVVPASAARRDASQYASGSIVTPASLNSSGCYPNTVRKRFTRRHTVDGWAPNSTRPSKPPCRCHANQKPSRSEVIVTANGRTAGVSTGVDTLRTREAYASHARRARPAPSGELLGLLR